MSDEEIDDLAARIAHHLQNTFSCRICKKRVEYFAEHKCEGWTDEAIKAEWARQLAGSSGPELKRDAFLK